MTVPTTSTLTSSTESSNKLLNNNANTKNSGDGLSFSATMNETVSNYKFDDQQYMLSDGQVLTAEQLLEMLENGNTLPGMNLPSLFELQQYKFQAGLNNHKFQPEISNTQLNNKMVQLDPEKYKVTNNFDLKQLPIMKQQFDHNLVLKTNTTIPEQLAVSLNSINQTSNIESDMTSNGFSAASSYQIINSGTAATGIMSNSFSIATPVQHPQWNQSLGQSVQWMVNQNIQQADIKLNPPELGVLDIRITVNNDQASVTFTTPNSAVREAIEFAMPRLRDMLEESGISLADVNVSEHSLEHGQTEQGFDLSEEEGNSQFENSVNTNSEEGINEASSQMQLGLLDTYA